MPFAETGTDNGDVTSSLTASRRFLQTDGSGGEQSPFRLWLGRIGRQSSPFSAGVLQEVLR